MNSEFIIVVYCLVFLFMKDECMVNSEDLFYSVGIYLVRVCKVFSVLWKNGYLIIKEGVYGGYLFSCLSDEIKFGELYCLVVGGLFGFNWCFGEFGFNCIVFFNMQDVMGSIYDGGEEVLIFYFDSILIEDVKYCIGNGEVCFLFKNELLLNG